LDLLVATKHARPRSLAIVFSGLLEEVEDPILDAPPAVSVEWLRRCRVEATPWAREPFVIHLGENEVEKLAEGGVLRHSFVAMDEVVASPERRLQHLRLGGPQPHRAGDVPGADRLVRERPV